MGQPGRVIGTRELIAPGTPYVVANRVRESAVEVLAVIHSAQQWSTSF
jgi:plasmid stabilization system protein ParE